MQQKVMTKTMEERKRGGGESGTVLLSPGLKIVQQKMDSWVFFKNGAYPVTTYDLQVEYLRSFQQCLSEEYLWTQAVM